MTSNLCQSITLSSLKIEVFSCMHPDSPRYQDTIGDNMVTYLAYTPDVFIFVIACVVVHQQRIQGK